MNIDDAIKSARVSEVREKFRCEDAHVSGQDDELERRFPAARFLGEKSGKDLTDHIAAADVFVFPSLTDTFGVVQLEALACGTPVAAFPVTGPIDVIADHPIGALDKDLRSAWQKSDRTLWRAKNTDTFKPMGPWIETNVKLDELVTKVRLNGKELIAFQTNHMVFGVVDFLVAMTRYLTLYPGDMVWMGTEGATENMQHGDTIEVEISQIGTLRNPVVREA